MLLIASLLLVGIPGAPSSVLVTTSKALAPRSEHLLLIASLLLVGIPGAPSSVLVTTSKALVTRSDALVTNSVLAPSRDARSP